MNLVVLAVGAVAVGGFLAKDKIQDEVTAASDSFTRFDPLYKKYGAQYGVPPKWLKAFAMNESSNGTHPSVAHGLEYPTDVEESASDDGLSWGLMQMTIPTARDYVSYTTAIDLNDPDFSVKVAARFVSDLMRQFPVSIGERRLEWIAKSYNQGAGNTRKEIRGEKTPRYDDVQKYWARYQRNLALVESKQGEL